MYSVALTIEFCYGHRLLNYQGKCSRLHGHNGRVEIEIRSAALNHQSMVADFTDIDASVRSWIDEHIDHRLILHRDDPLVAVLKKHDEPVFVMDSDPTAESIARLICDVAKQRGLEVYRVRLWETPAGVASYTPPPAE